MIAHQRPYSLWLEDIQDAAERIVAFTEVMNFEAFVASDLVRDAVLLRFLIIGEAARNLAIYFPGDDRHASLPLGSMRRMIWPLAPPHAPAQQRRVTNRGMS